jgi:hypothetical protein
MALKYGFPTKEELERIEKGLDPFFIERFPSKFENEFYRNWYIT